MAYKVPYNVTIGFHIMFRTEDGRIFGMPAAVEEIPDGGIEAVVEELIRAAAGQGFTPLTEEEYAAWAGELAAEEQRKRLSAAMHASTKSRAIDPARIDAILAAHKGRPGGDA